jgi:hypothetical protein
VPPVPQLLHRNGLTLVLPLVEDPLMMHKFVLGSFAVALVPLIAAGVWEALILLRALSFPSPPDPSAPPPGPSGPQSH